jgi:hypothetical protein
VTPPGLVERGLQFAAVVHLERDVAAAQQLALHIELGIGRPVGPALEAFAHLRVFEDVDVLEARATRAERADGLGREAALREIRRTLHEEHDRRGGELVLDALFDAHDEGLLGGQMRRARRRCSSEPSKAHCCSGVMRIQPAISSRVRRHPEQ